MAGTITLLGPLTPGIWTQGPVQAVTSIQIQAIPGLQMAFSATPGDNYLIVSQFANQPYNVANKSDLSQLWFRKFGGPITVVIFWN